MHFFVTIADPKCNRKLIFKPVCTISSIAQTYVSPNEPPHSTAQLFTINLGKEIHDLSSNSNKGITEAKQEVECSDVWILAGRIHYHHQPLTAQ